MLWVCSCEQFPLIDPPGVHGISICCVSWQCWWHWELLPLHWLFPLNSLWKFAFLGALLDPGSFPWVSFFACLEVVVFKVSTLRRETGNAEMRFFLGKGTEFSPFCRDRPGAVLELSRSLWVPLREWPGFSLDWMLHICQNCSKLDFFFLLSCVGGRSPQLLSDPLYFLIQGLSRVWLWERIKDVFVGFFLQLRELILSSHFHCRPQPLPFPSPSLIQVNNLPIFNSENDF